MSKRAEEAVAAFHNQALLDAQKYAQLRGGDISQEIAYGRGLKTGFIQGYEQAEKDTIERACLWLKTHLYRMESVEEIDLFNELFKNAMEEE